MYRICANQARRPRNESGPTVRALPDEHAVRAGAPFAAQHWVCPRIVGVARLCELRAAPPPQHHVTARAVADACVPEAQRLCGLVHPPPVVAWEEPQSEEGE